MKKIILTPAERGRALKSKRSTTPARMEEQSESPLEEKTPRARAIRNDLTKTESKGPIKRTATSPLLQHLMDKRRRTSTDTNSSTDEKKSQLSNVQRVKLKVGAESSSEQGINADKKMCATNSVNDSKDTLASEMKRLATTQGFWALKTASRSNSPVALNERGGGLLVSKSLSSSRKNSKSSTPDVSPSPSRRKPSNKVKKKQEEIIEELSKLNLPGKELNRLKTTEGFAYPIFSPSGLRSSSRDVSPSSTSSLERIGRQMARSHTGDEDKSLLGNLENSTPLLKGKRGRPKGKVDSSKNIVRKNGKASAAHSSTSNEDVTQTVDVNHSLAQLTSYSLMDCVKSVHGRPKNKVRDPGKPKKTRLLSDNSLNVSGKTGAGPVLSDIAAPSTNIDLSTEMENSSSKIKAGRGRPKLKKVLPEKKTLPASDSPVSHLTGVSELLNETIVGAMPSSEKAKRGRPRKQSNLDSNKPAKHAGAVKKLGRPKIVKENNIDSVATPIYALEAQGPKGLSPIKLGKAKQLKSKNNFEKQRRSLTLTDGYDGRLKMKKSGKTAVANEVYGVKFHKKTKGSIKKTKIEDNINGIVNDELQTVKVKKKKKKTEPDSTDPSTVTMDPILVEMQSFETGTGESIVKSKPKKIKLPKSLKNSIVSRLGRKSLGLNGKMRGKLQGINHKKTVKKRMAVDAVKPYDQLTELSRLTELKRLNTTVGFWSSPDVSSDMLVRRSKQVKMSEAKVHHGKKTKKPLVQMSFSKQISPKKHESSLLQHRKKKLNSLKHNLKKGKMFLNSDLLSNEMHSKTKSKRKNVLEDQSVQPKPATSEVLETTQKRGRKSLMELESFLSMSSQVEARRKGRSQNEDKSLELLEKIELETVTNINKLIEESEGLIKEDAKALIEAKLCSTGSFENKLTDSDMKVTVNLLKEHGQVEQFSLSVDSNEDGVIAMSSEHNKTLKDNCSGNVFNEDSPTYTPLTPQTEGTNTASVKSSENITTLTEVPSADQHSQSKPTDLVVADVIQTLPQNVEVVHKSSLSMLDYRAGPNAEDLPVNSFADADMENSGSCVAFSNVSSAGDKLDDTSLFNAEIVSESGKVLFGVDLDHPKHGNVGNSMEILNSNTDDVPVCTETAAHNLISEDVVMSLNAVAVDELNDKNSDGEPFIDDKIQVRTIHEKTLDESSQYMQIPVKYGEGSPISCNAISRSKETTELTSFDSALSSLEGLASNSDLFQVEGMVLNKHKKRKRMKTNFYRRKKHKLIEMRQKRLSALYGEAQSSNSAAEFDNVIDSRPSGSVKNENVYPKDPLRKVKKRRRNVWRKGVVKKPAYVAKKIRSKEQVASSQTADQFVLHQLEESENLVKESNSGPQVLEAPNTGLKSAKEKKVAMLRRLQTNANLANAILDENTLKGRFLRKQPAKSITLADGKMGRQKSKAGEISKGHQEGLLQQLTLEIPDEAKPRKRGRPRKLSGSLPKLTPTDIDSPNSNSNISWDQAPPPWLTPQNRTPPKPEEEPFSLLGKAENKGPPDSDFVAESVDETDLHLYLSGVSDEDLSPSKESSVASLEVNPKLPEFVPGMQTEDTTKLDLPVDDESHTLNNSPSDNKAKDLKKTGKTKMKGKKGKPPGIPMTEEEKSRKGRKSKSSSLVVSPSLYQDDLFKRPRTARKSMQNSIMYSPPISSQTRASGSTFSLRKKSTRSPLEMLEMKRRQEEAIYDQEEERRQARRILLREKRYARESGDGFSDDGEVLDEVPIKSCSVILSDFVKKLQLDNIDSPSETEDEDNAADFTKFSSPRYDIVDDQGDEDWCADLEDFEDVDDDEWLVKEKHDDRPYIPRLKLKRVMKKNKLLRIRRKNPSSNSPKSAQEPIKLVIKAEPVVDSGVLGYKATMDLSKVERSGFEGSYLDFLKGKTGDVEKWKSSAKKKSYISSQLSPKEDKDNKRKEGKSQNVASSPPKVPSLLITPGIGQVLKVGQYESTSVNAPSTCRDELNSSVTETPLTNSPKVLPVSEVAKNLSLGEEEDEDLLILDLEEGAQDQNSSGSFKGSPIAENPDAERKKVASHEVAENALELENNATHSTISEPLSHVQRTRSNDEMGLMLASYNEFDDPSTIINQQKSVTEDKIPDITDDTAILVTNNCNISEISVSNAPAEPVKDFSKDKISHSQSSVIDQVHMSESTTEIVSEDDQAGTNILSDSGNSPGCNNNVTVPAKSLSEPVKKTSHINENSISPRQITHTGSKPDEWKVKVILQSDKLPSGKYKCKRCDYTSSEKLSIESHIYSHIPGVQFRCAYCDSEFSSMSATWSHLKNVHAISEARLCISRHIEEKCFYEKEDVVFSDENNHTGSSQPTNINPGGQSPPVIISVLVSGTRSARSGAPRRYVCTHCGFSTNVKEDAEHHTSDLHKSHNLFACLLCNENIFSSEADIKQHSATVHPKRQRTYGKLPDFYDAEQLNSIGKSPSQEERGNIFEKMSSIFQGDETQQEANAIDHRQKAKDYLYLQEEWKEKTRVEADSTTAVDFMEDTLAEPSVTEQQLFVGPSSAGKDRISENEVLVDDVSIEVSKSAQEMCMKSSKQLSCDADITSSAVATSVTTEMSEEIMTSTLAASAPLTTSPNQVNTIAYDTDALGESISANLESTCTTRTKSQEDASLVDGEDVSNDDCMGLKIVQVVSLSQQNESATDDSELAECFKVVGQEIIKETTGHTTDQSFVEQLKTAGQPKEDEPQSAQACPAAAAEEVSTDSANTQLQAKDTEKSGSSAQMPASGHTSASSSFACGLPLSYKCNACRVHTPYLLMMVKHLKAKHPNMRCFACPYCKATHSFISQKQLRLHVRNSHPDKIGRNEIALSEEAKKFVEAMVLPNSPECIRVGNRVVLEEDIHTCTYCQVKMTSLANVYEHLNSKHSDLFEFVCPVCQNFKSKILNEIAIHCMQIHKSSLDTDKVHVSVPKNLFTVLTCISKGGKYIEKSLISPEDSTSKSGAAPAGISSDSSQPTPEVVHKTPNPQSAHRTIVDSPLSLQHTMSPMATPTPAAVQSFVGPVSQSIPQMTLLSQTPLIAIPIVSGSIGGIPSVSTTRPLIAFSSSLFDTSSLTSPPRLIMSSASKPTSVIQSTAGAASFLSPSQGLQHLPKSNLPTKQFSQQPVPRQKSSKNLPVLNIPTIKPRTHQPSVSVTPGRPVHEISIAPSSTPTPTGAHQSSHTSIAFKSPVVDNLPENEPSPDAFKIFNLRPVPQSPATSMAPPTNPIVFPPVSTPISSAFIQGPLAGFPANMVLPPNLMTQYAYSQPLMHPPKQSVPPAQTSKHIRPTVVSTPSAAPVPSPLGGSFPSHRMPSVQFGKKNQHSREVLLTKDQRYELQRQLLLQQQKQSHASTLSLHQTSKSGHFHITSHSPSSHTFNQLPSSLKHKEVSVSNPLPLSSSSSSSESMARPVKGVHKRSSSVYQCPYCPTLVILKPLEVASHIQQLHPGHQVTFKKCILNRGDH